MVSEITIRPAEELDVPKLVGLLRRSWLVTWAPNCRGQLCRRLLRLILHGCTPRRDGTVSWLQRAETCSLEWFIPTVTSSTRCTLIRPTGMAAWDRSCSVRLSGKSHVHTRLRVWKCVASTPGRALSTHAEDGWKCGVIREQNAGARSRMSRCRGLFECSAAQSCLGATGRCNRICLDQ